MSVGGGSGIGRVVLDEYVRLQLGGSCRMRRHIELPGNASGAGKRALEGCIRILDPLWCLVDFDVEVEV